MRYILNTIYLLLGALVSPLLLYSAIRYGKYRQGWSQKLFGLTPILPAMDRNAEQQRIWFHAVSVGEVNLLDTMLKSLSKAAPDAQVVISTTTKTGFELAKKKHGDKTVFYCPLDFSWAIRTAFRRIKPTVLVLVELELWPNLLMEAGRQDIPIAIVNGRLSDRSAKGYRRLGPLMCRWLENVSLVAAQSQQCADRFVDIGVPPNRVHFVGSMKFDGAKTERHNPQTNRLAKLFGLNDEDIVFVAGSTQSPEEQIAIRVFQRLAEIDHRLKLILVPRHPERADEVAAILDEANVAWTRRSLMDEQTLSANSRILLVDVVGELGGWWGTATMGFVGGSMGKRGGQNMLEPAAYGVATCFGPNTKNFRHIVGLLLQADAACVVNDEDGLFDFVKTCLGTADSGPDFAGEIGNRAKELVLAHRGATEETIRLLCGLTCGSVEFSRPADDSESDSHESRLRRPA